MRRDACVGAALRDQCVQHDCKVWHGPVCDVLEMSGPQIRRDLRLKLESYCGEDSEDEPHVAPLQLTDALATAVTSFNASINVCLP